MRASVDWEKIKLFHYVAKAGSFTAAGEILNISQSSLSRSIQALEYQMRVQLFQRMSRGLLLTKQGEALLQATEQAFEAFSRAETLMLEDSDEIEGSLKIATTMSLAIVWLMPYLSDFLDLHPKLKCSVIGSDEHLDLKMREADVSIGPLMADKPELIQEYLMSFHMKLYASQHYLDTHGVLEKPEDLSHHKLIIFGYDAASPYSDVNWLLKVGMPKGTLREPYLCVNAGLAMQKAAEAHHGIVSLSAEHHAINNSTLVEILPALEKPIIPIYYIYTHDMQHSKRIQMLGDHLKKQCQQ